MVKITNNCKISEITKNGEKITQIDINVEQCKKMPKTAKKYPNLKYIFFIVFLARNYLKNGTSCFHTMFGSRDTHFRSFLAKIRIFGSNFQPNQRNYS